MVRALVTGGCGFIGSALVRDLAGERGRALERVGLHGAETQR